MSLPVSSLAVTLNIVLSKAKITTVDEFCEKLLCSLTFLGMSVCLKCKLGDHQDDLDDLDDGREASARRSSETTPDAPAGCPCRRRSLGRLPRGALCVPHGESFLAVMQIIQIILLIIQLAFQAYL